MTACRSHPDCPFFTTCCCVDGINLDVRVNSVAVEQDSTSSKVGNFEMVREALVSKVLNRLLWRNNVPFARNVLQ